MKTTEAVLLTAAKGVKATAQTCENGSSHRVLRVWVVDDNSALRNLYAQLLNKQPGIRCTRQFPSAEAILTSLAEERPPDMILLDVNLRGQSGLSTIQPIKRLAPSVKVLMFTMFNNTHYELEAFNSGASGFLLKSYGIDEVVNLLREAHLNPSTPQLFPNIALYKEAELERKKAASQIAGKRFSLAGAWRRLCSAPRRQTAH
jgi:DNA-binding NarL/FixJ family response regulator